MYTKILKYISDLDVASNEYQTKYSLQRIINKLLENDKLLMDFYSGLFGKFYIYAYQSNQTYKYNDIVWFLDNDKELHILRCDIPKFDKNLNQLYPARSFEQIGWKDLNPDTDILEDYGIKPMINQYLKSVFRQHTDDEQFHPYKKISYDKTSKNFIESKIMRTDFSNAAASREYTFFPYRTIYLQPDDQILKGYGRIYDNGLLEYDIVFRLSYGGYKCIDEEYGISADTLSCNNLNLRGTAPSKYFYSLLDQKIFNSTDSTDSEIFSVNQSQYQFSADMGDTVEYGKTDYVNTYSAEIKFAQEELTQFKFKDSDYMIFCSDVMSQDKDTTKECLNPASNAMTFINKTAKSFIAVYVMYPNMSNFQNTGYNAEHSGLRSNSFHCQLVGRWK